MQIVLKVHHGANRPKIAYIIDAESKKRGCYARNMNYKNFEERILDIISKICKNYINEKKLETICQKIDNLSLVKDEIKKIDRTMIFRLIDKIEIDKDKNIFINFNFAPLKNIGDNKCEYIEVEELLNNIKNDVG